MEDHHTPYVVLGFKSKLPPASSFPSKCGGKPNWLHPSLPSKLKCLRCSGLLTFFLQLYCPVENPNAFHRTLFVFVCLSQTCSGNTIRVFRSQLPEHNPFYPPESLDEPKNQSEASEEDPVALFLGEDEPKEPEQQETAQSSQPQKQEILLQSKQQSLFPLVQVELAQLLPEFSIDSQEEQENVTQLLIQESQRISKGRPEMSEEAEELYMGHASKDKAEKMMAKFIEEEEKGGGSGLDGDQEEIKEETSQQFQLFSAICNQNPSQILRYTRSSEIPVLLYSPQDREELGSLSEKCGRCGGPLISQIQVMPQILSICESKLLKQLDWAYVLIKTCKDSCECKEGYAEELGHVVLEAQASQLKEA